MTDARDRERLLREPLLHFLLIGIGMFVLYSLMRSGDSGAPREIVITEARVEALADSFATTWMRPPTADEIKGLVDDFIAEEIYYREAIAIGLDQDDTVVRRRLRQKMEFISDAAAAAVEPTDAQLRDYLAKHPEKFVSPAALTFQQVYFSAERRGEATTRQAEQLLVELQAGRGIENVEEAGDPTLLPRAMQSASPQDVANAFGSEFAAQLEEAPVGQWAGLLQSGFGLHLVKVDRREAGSLPTLEQIRPIVLREWQSAQRSQSNQKFLSDLRAQYEVRIEGPVAALFELAAPGNGSRDAGGG
jgi:hypothetical protein